MTDLWLCMSSFYLFNPYNTFLQFTVVLSPIHTLKFTVGRTSSSPCGSSHTLQFTVGCSSSPPCGSSHTLQFIVWCTLSSPFGSSHTLHFTVHPLAAGLPSNLWAYVVNALIFVNLLLSILSYNSQSLLSLLNESCVLRSCNSRSSKSLPMSSWGGLQMLPFLLNSVVNMFLTVNQHATTEEMLEAVFAVQFMMRIYSFGQWEMLVKFCDLNM